MTIPTMLGSFMSYIKVVGSGSVETSDGVGSGVGVPQEESRTAMAIRIERREICFIIGGSPLDLVRAEWAQICAYCSDQEEK